MGMLILVSVVSWIILTLLRVGVHLFLANGLGIERANGHWLYLTPQIILITIYSYAIVAIFRGFDKESLLVLGAIWLVLVLCFEFIGILVIQKKSLDELFEGWKIWKGHIWTLVLLSHLFMPYIIKHIAK
jgi:hypothetical protein